MYRGWVKGVTCALHQQCCSERGAAEAGLGAEGEDEQKTNRKNHARVGPPPA